MEHYIFCYRDKKLGCYTTPHFEIQDKEHFAEAIIRSIKKSQPTDRGNIIDMALYYLGFFDDVEGTFVLLPTPEKLLDCEDYLAPINE